MKTPMNWHFDPFPSILSLAALILAIIAFCNLVVLSVKAFLWLMLQKFIGTTGYFIELAVPGLPEKPFRLKLSTDE